jgi:hypothetical protein
MSSWRPAAPRIHFWSCCWKVNFSLGADEETFAFREAVSRGRILRQAAYLEIIVPRSSAKWRIISIVIALISTQNCAAAARV